MNDRCDICGCKYSVSLWRTSILHLKGSEDDYICNRCRHEIAKFARSLQAVVDNVRWKQKETTNG